MPKNTNTMRSQIDQAALLLKGLGVRLFCVGLTPSTPTPLWHTASIMPTYERDFDDVHFQYGNLWVNFKSGSGMTEGIYALWHEVGHAIVAGATWISRTTNWYPFPAHILLDARMCMLDIGANYRETQMLENAACFSTAAAMLLCGYTPQELKGPLAYVCTTLEHVADIYGAGDGPSSHREQLNTAHSLQALYVCRTIKAMQEVGVQSDTANLLTYMPILAAPKAGTLFASAPRV